MRLLLTALILSGLAAGSGQLWAQPVATPDTGTEGSAGELGTTVSSFQAFRGIAIGMPIDQVKELLLHDALFNYRGDPDVYFLPGKDQLLLECSGNGFVKRAYFQFVENKLFAMIIDFNENKIDYFSIMTTLLDKYGAYTDFTPQWVRWEKENIRLSLEKPLTVKYLDLVVFQKLKAAGQTVETEEEKTLKNFLEEF